jgi:hypothetical protein
MDCPCDEKQNSHTTGLQPERALLFFRPCIIRNQHSPHVACHFWHSLHPHLPRPVKLLEIRAGKAIS